MKSMVLKGAKTLMSAHPCRIIYAVGEEDDAKRFRKTGLYHQIDGFKQDKPDNVGGSESEAQRALCSAELGTLDF